jgi:hypothetical protein
MVKRPKKTNQLSPIQLSIGILLAAALLGGLSWALASKPVALKPTIQSSPTPTLDTTTSSDATKERFASPTLSPVSNQTPAVSPSSTPQLGGNYIVTFGVNSRTDGFHVVTILKTVTAGTCSVTIHPTDGGVVSGKGSIIVSGTSSMCEFGGDIPGSGTTGSAELVITANDGSSQTSGTNF